AFCWSAAFCALLEGSSCSGCANLCAISKFLLLTFRSVILFGCLGLDLGLSRFNQLRNLAFVFDISETSALFYARVAHSLGDLLNLARGFVYSLCFKTSFAIISLSFFGSIRNLQLILRQSRSTESFRNVCPELRIVLERMLCSVDRSSLLVFGFTDRWRLRLN